MTPEKQKGNAWERAVAAHLNSLPGFGFVKRTAGQGSARDIGDLDLPAVGWEGQRTGLVGDCKNHRQLRLAEWVDGAAEQATAYADRFPVGRALGTVFIPRRGRKPGQGYAVMTIDDWAALVRLAEGRAA